MGEVVRPHCIVQRCVSGGRPERYLGRGSGWNSAVTLVLGVATATEPYSGQRRFQISTSSWPSESPTPHIWKWMRIS